MLSWLIADWPFKLLSLGLAFGIWVWITGENRIPATFDIALDPQLPQEHILGETPPSQVTVRLVGPESVIRNLNPLAMTVQLDLTKLPPGEREMQLTEAFLTNKPARVDVEFFDPERVRLVVDERRSRQLKVTPIFTGTLPEGYTLYRAQVDPEKVLVEGPLKRVSQLTDIQTEPIELDDQTRRFIKRVAAVPGVPHVRLVDPQLLEVRVDVDVSPVEKSFSDLPVQPSIRSYETKFRPSVAGVTLAGPPALLERITPAQIRVTGDVGELSPASGSRRVPLQVAVDLPPEQASRVSVKVIRPHQATVRLSERSETE
jgi:YbbR domain-containing protein